MVEVMNRISIDDLKRTNRIVRLIKNFDDGMAALTHYAYNSNNEFARYFKKDAIKFVKQIFQYKFPKGVTTNKQLKETLQYLINEINEKDILFPEPVDPQFTFIDLFAGIGGIRIGFQDAGGKCVFSSEWNNYSKITYEANFGEVPFGDIKEFTKPEISDKQLNNLIPNHDVLCGGFPCQPFSLAGVSKKNSLGKKHGFLDETQGTLFFDLARIIKAKRPKAFVLENVKNLISHDSKNTFKTIEKVLIDLEYNLHVRVIDGKHYVPQHRERIFIVGFDIRQFKAKEKFEFPESTNLNYVVEDILDKKTDMKYTLSDKLWKYLQGYAKKHKELGNGFGYGLANMDGITRTLSARYYKDGAEILIPQNNKNPRRLTPRECARLQGYPETFTFPVSDAQAYRQFGNSVVVPLLRAIAKKVQDTLSQEI